MPCNDIDDDDDDDDDDDEEGDDHHLEDTVCHCIPLFQAWHCVRQPSCR
jgi:hypothetical protein